MIAESLFKEHWSGRIALLICLAVCLSVAGIGGLVTSYSVGSWYASLLQPAWTPPAWVFSPVWTILYVMMAVAAWLVWLNRDLSLARTGIVLFAIQLALNLAWSILFFGLRNPLAGLVDIALLWLAILATLIVFARVSSPAGWLMMPYLAWVTYASALNFALWRMNA
jgi:translocator protein